MASKRVADIIAKTYFSNGEGKERVLNSVNLSPSPRYVNPNIFLLAGNIVLIIVLILGWKMGTLFHANNYMASSELRIASKQLPMRVSFDFKEADTSSIEYYLNLGGADVSEFKAIAFDVRFNRGDNHSIRVKFSNGYNEMGEIGIPSLGKRWKEVVIYLKDVPGISSWNDVRQIGFILDKWNVSTEKGTMYIDNVRFVEGT